MSKMRADYTRGIHDRYRKNIEGTIQGFRLEVTAGNTAYCKTDQGGSVKLDSLLLGNGVLCCELPNGESVELMNTKDGLKQKAPGYKVVPA